jgi:hypothetical protein
LTVRPWAWFMVVTPWLEVLASVQQELIVPLWVVTHQIVQMIVPIRAAVPKHVIRVAVPTHVTLVKHVIHFAQSLAQLFAVLT